MEIRNGNTVIKLDRPQLEAEGNGDVYRLRFDGDAVFGKAAPNTYRGPCTWGDASALSFGTMASTMMFAVKEPAALKEHDYYTYLTHVNGWGLTASGRLELYCADQSGRAVLVYGRP
jgi:heat shock protein HslJ